jgi:hypothetical protein
LIPLILTPHSKNFSLKLGSLLSGRVAVLHHLLLHQLFLRQALPLGLLALSLFKIALLLCLVFETPSLLGITCGLERSLLFLVLLQHASLLVNLCLIGRRRRRRGRLCGSGRSLWEIRRIARIDKIGRLLENSLVDAGRPSELAHLTEFRNTDEPGQVLEIGALVIELAKVMVL